MSEQTSHKSGKRSMAQKQDETRHPFDAVPPARPVAGAFGKSGRPESPEGEEVTEGVEPDTLAEAGEET
jgi:hypothetical protein